MPIATEEGQQIATIAGTHSTVTRWVSLGILMPQKGRPGPGVGYTWTPDDVKDAHVARSLIDLGVTREATALALQVWRKHQRPEGIAGVASRGVRMRGRCWTDADGLAADLREGWAVAAVPTW